MNNIFVITCKHNQSFHAIFENYHDALESIKYSYHAMQDLKVIVDSMSIKITGTDWQGLFIEHIYNIREVKPLTGIHHL